jgi:hypothetical protein
MVWLLIALAVVVGLLWADHTTKKRFGDGLSGAQGTVLPGEQGIVQDHPST